MVDLHTENHEIDGLDLEIEMEMTETENGEIEAGVEIEIEEVKGVVEREPAKVVEVEAKRGQIRSEVGAKNEVINVAGAEARNVEDGAKVMKEKEAAVVKEEGSVVLDAEVLEEDHLHPQAQDLVVDLDDPEAALQLIFL